MDNTDGKKISRSSGILLHISSLPNDYGIGTFGEKAYEFVDLLVESGQKYWQILPLGPTGYGDSPYQSYSSHGGNPYFIDFEILRNDKLLEEDDYSDLYFGSNPKKVDYNLISRYKMEVLFKAYRRFDFTNSDYIRFMLENSSWLYDYALYMSLKKSFENKSWQMWEEGIRNRESHYIEYYSDVLRDEMRFNYFLQFQFYKQYFKLKKYANNKGIYIIGDLPIYVAEDSCDVWTRQELFMLDNHFMPTEIAGCPPDAFSEKGQLWGNPIYNWPKIKEEGYKWWLERIGSASKLYDTIRLDHFRGFDSFWAVPYGDSDAVNGKWMPGPGIELFYSIEKNYPDINFIAEDLGILTDSVRTLRNMTGYPGMKILQFAFDVRDESEYLPHNIPRKSIVYTGTHDNDTIMGWYNSQEQDVVEYVQKYLKLDKDEGYNWGIIRGAMMSPAYICIFPVQDLLGLGSEARMNFPSTIGNWDWKLTNEQFYNIDIKRLKEYTVLYSRNNIG